MNTSSLPPLLLVTGGTGTLGTHVIQRLRERGCRVRVLSRRVRDEASGVEYVVGDLIKGIGVDKAVAGSDVIVHCASASKGDANATRNLVKAAKRQKPLPHLVYVSIVGVSGIRFGYFQAKLAAEKIVADSGLPWTLQRATQFYDYFFNAAQSLTRLPIVPVPKAFRVQPIDPAEVANMLTDLALGPPSGRVRDIGGPEISTWAEMTRQYLRASKRQRPVVEVWLPLMKEIRAGALLVSAEAGGASNSYGKTTWKEFLQRRLQAAKTTTPKTKPWTDGFCGP
jgi:uncharacterized protein YbjT (DUF2867 family)